MMPITGMKVDAIRKIFLSCYILSLCLASSESAEIVSLCDDSGARSPSLYEQYCCVRSNKGSTIVNHAVIKGRLGHYILCPPEIPASCSSIYFSPSCSAILTTHPTAISGDYKIMLANGTVITVYCDMEGVNCDGEGGWTKLAYLNMSDSSEQCPPGFRLYEENGIRACGRQSSGCQSVEFPSIINYTRVCGRVIGYQQGTPDAFFTLYAGNADATIDDAYADGVSITRGNPRTHIWTYLAALQENVFHAQGHHECPFAPNSPVTPPSFVGNDYFCESGNPGGIDFKKLYTDDPLWDGKQCGLLEEASCNVTGIPWFNKALEQPTTDYIELRVCGDMLPVIEEDAPVAFYEIYIK